MNATQVYRPALLAGLPRLDILCAALRRAFHQQAGLNTEIELLKREPLVWASTHPSEILTLRIARGPRLRVLCKYEAAQPNPALRRRSGPGYEALVYREILGCMPGSRPAFLGALNRYRGSSWLFIEYLSGSQRLDDMPAVEEWMVRAAAWSGRFHARPQTSVRRRGLNIYDREFYSHWAGRVRSFGKGNAFRWLTTACDRFERSLDALVVCDQTVIHGEYTPHNVLCRRSQVCPIDWECAGIGPGQIDLASLTDGWPKTVVRRCEAAYAKARWSSQPPADFQTVLILARFYWNLRWLGHKKNSFDQPKGRKRQKKLHRLAEQLGWI